MITDSSHQMAIDDLVVAEAHPVPREGCWFNTYAEGWDFGGPEPVEVAITSLISDGQLVRHDRHGNRQVRFVVEISAADSDALSAGERVLWRTVQSASELRWVGPDGLSPTTVFDVFAGQIKLRSIDTNELRLLHAYEVVLTCYPWTRGDTYVTRTLAVTAPTYVEVDGCSTTTGWALTGRGTTDGSTLATLTAESGHLKIAPNPAGLHYPATLTRASAALGSQPYFGIDVSRQGNWGWDSIVGRIKLGGVLVDPVAVVASPTSGYTRYIYRRPVGGGSIVLQVWGWSTEPVLIDSIMSATALPSTVPSIEVPGSARTQCSLAVAASAGMVYSDPTMLTHGWSPSDPATWVRAPGGEYALYGFTGASGSLVRAVVRGQSDMRRIGTAAPGAGALGPFILNANRYGVIGDPLSFTTNGSAPLDLTGLRLFRYAPGESALIAWNTSGLTGMVQIDSPSRSLPLGGVFGRLSSDSNPATMRDISDRCTGWGSLVLQPGPNAIWNANGATVGFWPRWHTFAERVAA